VGSRALFTGCVYGRIIKEFANHGFICPAAPFMRCNTTCGSHAHKCAVFIKAEEFIWPLGKLEHTPAVNNASSRRVVWGSTSLGMKTLLGV
jgi:hypothetical protein